MHFLCDDHADILHAYGENLTTQNWQHKLPNITAKLQLLQLQIKQANLHVHKLWHQSTHLHDHTAATHTSFAPDRANFELSQTQKKSKLLDKNTTMLKLLSTIYNVAHG